MSQYNSYHTAIKTCFALKIQHQILPKKFILQIPASTSHYWKNESADKYLGAEFANDIQNNLDHTKIFLDKRLTFSRKSFIRFAKIYLTLINLLGKDNIKKVIKTNRNIFIDLLENISDNFPMAKKDLLRFLFITKSQYSFWLGDRKFACSKSLIGQCFKRRPRQIANSEISILKKYMENLRYKHWCIRSIWGKAIRDNAISMAESTWYKYVRKLGYSDSRRPMKKSRPKGSFDAFRPNQTWHMDLSQFKTTDNVTFYIYTVVDNFSRKIIAWDIAQNKSPKIRMQTVKEAIKNEFDIEIKDQSIDLIVDGGTENNNKTIGDFIKNCHISINKKIALRDVTFSNSIVEGPYKIMKSYYFRTKDISSFSIKNELENFITDYNYHRPCYKHRIYTPDEVHKNPNLASVKLVLEKSNQKRLEENRNFCCKINTEDSEI